MILHCLGKHKKDSFARCLSRFLPVPICFLHCSTRGASRARRTRGASYARRARGASYARGASRTRCARRTRCPYGSCSTRGTSRASKPRGTSDARGSRRTRYTRRTSCARCSSGAGRSRDTGAAGASGQAVRFRKHFIALLIAGTREALADADSVVSCHFFLPCTDTYARQSEAAPDCPYDIVCRKRKKRDASAWRENHSVAEIGRNTTTHKALHQTKHYKMAKRYKKNSTDILPRRFFKIPYSRHKIISRSCASRRRREPSRTESP